MTVYDRFILELFFYFSARKNLSILMRIPTQRVFFHFTPATSVRFDEKKIPKKTQ